MNDAPLAWIAVALAAVIALGMILNATRVAHEVGRRWWGWVLVVAVSGFALVWFAWALLTVQQ
jgi:uncharacterized membrane protein YecN with MAPEG domain